MADCEPVRAVQFWVSPSDHRKTITPLDDTTVLALLIQIQLSPDQEQQITA